MISARWLVVLAAVVGCVSFDADAAWPPAGFDPPNIQPHGPNGYPFNVDSGRYVRTEPRGGGSAAMIGEYLGNAGNPPKHPVFTGTQIATASQIARAARSLARFAGPVGLGLQLAELIWDGSKWMRTGAGAEHIFVREGTGANGTRYSSVTAGGQALCPTTANNPYGPGNTPYTFAYVEWQNNHGGRVRCENGVPNWWTNVNFQGLHRCTSGNDVVFREWNGNMSNAQIEAACGAGPTQEATDAELEAAIKSGLEANPNLADDVAQNASNTTAGEQYFDLYLPAPTASGPASTPAGTQTSTTTGPGGQTTSVTNTTYNYTYAGDNVYMTVTTTTTTTNPDGTQTTTTNTSGPTPSPDPEDPPEEGNDPPPEEKDLCKEHPNISACAELGEVEDSQLQQETKNVALSPTMSDAGSCPSPRSATIHTGQTVMFSYQPFCDVATGIRPIVIAMSWLGAGLWLFYIARGTQ